MSRNGEEYNWLAIGPHDVTKARANVYSTTSATFDNEPFRLESGIATGEGAFVHISPQDAPASAEAAARLHRQVGELVQALRRNDDLQVIRGNGLTDEPDALTVHVNVSSRTERANTLSSSDYEGLVEAVTQTMAAYRPVLFDINAAISSAICTAPDQNADVLSIFPLLTNGRPQQV